MFIKRFFIAFFSGIAVFFFTLKLGHSAEDLVFTRELPSVNNITGAFQGEVAFMQTHLVFPSATERQHADQFERPKLIANRDALLLFTPIDHHHATQYIAQVADRGFPLDPPEQLPRSDQPLYGVYGNKPRVLYSTKSWSALVPGQYLNGESPMVKIIRASDHAESSAPLELSAPTERVLININIGMLTEPQDTHTWTKDPARMSLDFFHKTPISRLTASQYLPAHFRRITLANGTVYTHRSAQIYDYNAGLRGEKASVYLGDLATFARSTVCGGIGLANVGTIYSGGSSLKWPRNFKQTVVHTSIGKYTSPDGGEIIGRHGCYGLEGTPQLLSTTDNEYTHELGHGDGIQMHYPGGIKSIQSIEAGWGYDPFRDRLLGNLFWYRNNIARIEGGHTREPFAGQFQFNTDAMACGGVPGSHMSLFTSYTPYSAKIIQDHLEDIGVLNPYSSSGYRKWNKDSRSMEDASSLSYPRPTMIGVPVITLIGYYDPERELTGQMYPALFGNWGNVFEPVEDASARFTLSIQRQDGTEVTYPLGGRRLSPREMNKFHLNLKFDSSNPWICASLFCQAGGTREIVDRLSIETPESARCLPNPIVVGGDDGYGRAALSLLEISEYFREQFLTLDEFEEKLEGIYGKLRVYQPDNPINLGCLYTTADHGRYFQSLGAGASLPEPSLDERLHWRYLGESAPYILPIYDMVSINQATPDYSLQARDRSSIYFYIPVNKHSVLYADSCTENDKKWGAGKGYTKVIVNAINQTDTLTYRLTLRGNKQNIYRNFEYKLNEGLQKECGVAKITFEAVDNLGLAAGSYFVDFPMIAQGWHDPSFKKKIQVRGSINHS